MTFSIAPTMREAIEARLHHLPRKLRRQLDLAAVIGGEFDFALLQRAGQMEEEPLLDALDELLETGLLIEPRAAGRREFALAHDRYAEVAYDTLPRIRRRRLHGRVADAMRHLYGDDPASSADLAFHYHRSGQLAAAVPFSVKAGEYALRLYAGREAAAHFDEALQWAEEAALVLDEGYVGAIHVSWADALRRSGRYGDALSHYPAALPLAQGEMKQEAIYQICALGAMRGGSLTAFGRLAASLEEALVGTGDTWALAFLRCMQGFLAAFQGKAARARDCTAEGWRIGRRLIARGDEVPALRLARAYGGLARCHEWWADWRHAIRYAGKALALYAAHDDLNGVASCQVTLGGAYYGLGEWGQALEHVEGCFRLSVDAGDPRMQGEALFRSGLIHLERGDWARAEGIARQILSTADSVGDTLRQLFGQFLLARLAVCRGAPAEALPVLELVEQVSRAADAMSVAAQVMPLSAEAHLVAGDVEAARAGARAASELALRCGLKRERGEALRIQGEALAQSGESAEAERCLRRAIAVAGSIGCRYDLARARRSLGTVHLRRGEPGAAREQLEVAASLFEDLGAERDLAAVHELALSLTGPGGGERRSAHG